MTTVTAYWLRTAGCSSLVLVAAAAFAQSEPGATSQERAPTGSPSSSQDAPLPTREQCFESHRKAQQYRNEGKLVEAREQARTCTSLVCPGPLISDCSSWLSDLDERIPSVVFEVRVDGEPNVIATVTADGFRVNEWTRGEILRMNPGEHEFRVELEPYEPVVRKLMLTEGMRYRIVPVEFRSDGNAAPAGSPKAPAPPLTAPTQPSAAQPPLVPPAPATERPTPISVYPLLGLGVVGLGGAVVFSALGSKEESDLEKTCKPNCSDSQVAPMDRDYLLSDISLGVGVASLITAGVIYLARPEKPADTTVGFVPLPGGASGFASYRF